MNLHQGVIGENPAQPSIWGPIGGLLIVDKEKAPWNQGLDSYCWRRGWDSNPRRAFTLAGFQDQCIQPLCHLSGDLNCDPSGGSLRAARGWDGSQNTLASSAAPRFEPTKGFHPCWFSRPVHGLRARGACPSLRSGLLRPLCGLHIELACGSVQPLCHLSGDLNCALISCRMLIRARPRAPSPIGVAVAPLQRARLLLGSNRGSHPPRPLLQT